METSGYIINIIKAEEPPKYSHDAANNFSTDNPKTNFNIFTRSTKAL